MEKVTNLISEAEDTIMFEDQQKVEKWLTDKMRTLRKLKNQAKDIEKEIANVENKDVSEFAQELEQKESTFVTVGF